MSFAMTTVTVIDTVTDVTAITMSRVATTCSVMIKLPFLQVTLSGAIMSKAQASRSGVSQQQGSVEADEEGRVRSLMMFGRLCHQVPECRVC